MSGSSGPSRRGRSSFVRSAVGFGPTAYGLGPKSGTGEGPCYTPMTDRRMPGRGRRRGRWDFRALIGVGVTALLLSVTVASFGSGSSSGADWSSTELAWSNGVAQCIFVPGTPTVAVSAMSLAGSGLSATLASLDEVTASGNVTAVAALSSANWSSTNLSNPDRFDMAYATDVPIVSPVDSAQVLGSVGLRVDYLLPAYADSPGTNLRNVTQEVTIANWTWQGTGDRLVFSVSLWPTFTALERLTAPSPTSYSVMSVEVSTGEPRESFDLGRSANISLPGKGSFLAPVTPEAQVALQGAYASVGLWVGAVAGEFRSLSYVSVIALPVPKALAGLPPYEYAAAGGAGFVAVAVLALTARRLRRKPSDLTFVEEQL